MNERTVLTDKMPEVKSQNPAPQIRRRTEISQSMNSPVDRILYLQRTIGNQAVSKLMKSGALQAKLRIGQPGDIYEQEADRVAEQIMRMPDVSEVRDTRIQRKCPKCLKERSGLPGKDKKEEKLQAKEISSKIPEIAPQIESNINSLKGGGQPLAESTRAFFEQRFGQDFSQVRVHTDAKAAESAQAVNAKAYTVGNNMVFGKGEYEPEATVGRRLLAHELTHVVQQVSRSDTSHKSLGPSNQADEHVVRHHPGGKPTLCRSVVTTGEPTEKSPVHGEAGPPKEGYVVPLAAPPTAAVPRPETCPPPESMICPPAVSSPGAVTNTLIFPVNSAALNTKQKTEIDATAASWHAAGSSVIARIDGYASAEGECRYNWGLSCRRAQAVATELETPSDGSPGVPNGKIEVFAHGESEEAGRKLAPNRKTTISIPVAPTPPLIPSPPPCTFPVTLGIGRTGCGYGTDFTHFDFPGISFASEMKLVAWAAAHPGSRFHRSLITNAECETEMDTVLTATSGGAGHAAFSRFAAGTGGTETLGSSSTLGALALVSPSFIATTRRVQASIEAQLAAMAPTGILDPCALRVTPPETHFSLGGPDNLSLQAVIGGTHGERLFATGFVGNIPMRSYSIDLRFLICDNFGVDEHDLYAPGLIAFWVLQHERSATLYAPFINELDLPVTLSGTF